MLIEERPSPAHGCANRPKAGGDEPGRRAVRSISKKLAQRKIESPGRYRERVEKPALDFDLDAHFDYLVWGDSEEGC